MKKLGVIIMIALAFYLESGEKYGGHVVQMDYWQTQDGAVWCGRDGKHDGEMGPNPKYLYTKFRTATGEILIPKTSPEGSEL